MKPIKILLIEDDEDYRVLVKALLDESDLQFEIEEVSSSENAEVKLASQSYDCVLCDYIIPDITGVDLMKKTKESGIKTPFIMMTAWGDKSLEEELIKQGASSYISKDALNLDSLQSKIRAAVADNLPR